MASSGPLWCPWGKPRPQSPVAAGGIFCACLLLAVTQDQHADRHVAPLRVGRCRGSLGANYTRPHVPRTSKGVGMGASTRAAGGLALVRVRVCNPKSTVRNRRLGDAILEELDEGLRPHLLVLERPGHVRQQRRQRDVDGLSILLRDVAEHWKGPRRGLCKEGAEDREGDLEVLIRRRPRCPRARGTVAEHQAMHQREALAGGADL